MATRPLVSPRMLGGLRNFYPSSAQIQAANTTTQDSFGQITAGWTAVAGYESVPCVIAPAGVTETKGQQSTVSEATHMVSLAAAVPTLTAAHRLLVDGQPYDVLGAEVDSRGITTHVDVKQSTI